MVITVFGVAAALKMFHVKQNLFFGVITATVIISLAVIFYLCIYRKNYSVEVSITAITVKSGVIIKKKRILPSPRFVFAETYITPLEKLFNLEVIAFRAVKARLFTMPLDAKDAEETLGEISGNK